ncbi:MAG: hypothetical protein WCZ20_03795 [Hydrogenophaga sp.]|jgi:uncharacterized membrane protein|uniref:COG4648 family protein n=1 Tax=Hydrogenophaga sp. TaxID=1904254 RepID=UPI000EDB1D8C|nr:hypothetical protein [Hydrogenophaga sp.]MDD3784715.1 hypothetical protein [Hydrogenophaga sp.]HAJ12640.1 hypothetical protein [Comamonadaceae bacterium]
MNKSQPGWRALLAVLLVLGWIASAHLASSGIGPADLHTVVAVAPLLAAAAALLWQTPLRGAPAWGLMLLMAGGLAWRWGWLRGNLPWLYYLQHLGTHLAMAAWFGRSLMAGREPVVTGLARMIFGDGLSERKRGYTRQVTLGWTVFFVVNALVSTLLFAWAPIEVWSVHANVLTGPLIGLVFLVEMLVRRCVLPPAERPGVREIIEAWRSRQDPGRTTTTRSTSP